MDRSQTASWHLTFFSVDATVSDGRNAKGVTHRKSPLLYVEDSATADARSLLTSARRFGLSWLGASERSRRCEMIPVQGEIECKTNRRNRGRTNVEYRQIRGEVKDETLHGQPRRIQNVAEINPITLHTTPSPIPELPCGEGDSGSPRCLVG